MPQVGLRLEQLHTQNRAKCGPDWGANHTPSKSGVIAAATLALDCCAKVETGKETGDGADDSAEHFPARGTLLAGHRGRRIGWGAHVGEPGAAHRARSSPPRALHADGVKPDSVTKVGTAAAVSGRLGVRVDP